MHFPASVTPLRLSGALVAIALPLLLSLAAVPDTVFYNQLAAFAGWGVWLIRREVVELSRVPRPPMLAATGALALCALQAMHHASTGQGAVALALLAAIVVLWSGTSSGEKDAVAIARAWGVAGLLCTGIALVQYFAPSLADGGLIARNSTPGRAVGNLRQPNHLATALLCAMVMTAWLWQAGRLRASWAAASLVAMVLGVALSASRTGALALLVLTAWAALDTSQPRTLRWTLAATPLLYLACWAALAGYASLQEASFYASARLEAGGDISSSRFAIWRNALALIAQQPWTGVGWGNFNFAWTFTPFPDRPVAFFDHTHSLPLQLAVEIGVPATLAVLGLLGWALWRSRFALARPDPGQPSIARAALAMLAVLALHSLLEYPLWYAYFLLPAAWTLGAFLGSAPPAVAPTTASRHTPAMAPWLLRGAGVLLLLGAAWAGWEHRRIELIFAPTAGSGTLESRIARGQQGWLFGHHADYAAATNPPTEPSLAAFRRPLHMLVDTRLLIAYIEALREAGRHDEALYAAQRLREFRRPEAQVFFKDCTPGNAAAPFQCETRAAPLTWRDLEP